MSRSQSLPFELSSLSMRCAKFGQGTNSYFIAMPVLAVKSFDSSTSALAGSQAAQHSVNCFCCACALPLISTAIANALAAMATLLLLKLILGLQFDELRALAAG